ncbi:hypothetical protein DKP78_17725, partial [Enterococcus faecium]
VPMISLDNMSYTKKHETSLCTVLTAFHIQHSQTYSFCTYSHKLYMPQGHFLGLFLTKRKSQKRCLFALKTGAHQADFRDLTTMATDSY